MIEARPWSEELEYPVLRAVWILMSLILLPSLLLALGVPKGLVPFFSTLTALPACAGNIRQLGIKSPVAADFSAAVGMYIVIIIFSAAITPLWQDALDKLQIPYSEKQDDILELLNSGNLRDKLLLFLSVCVITPVVEEVLFRRIIYAWLMKINLLAGVLVTSLLFSVGHFFIFGIPSLLIMGVAFQLIFLLRKNLLAAMILHGIVNTMVFVAHYFFLK